MSLQAYNPWPDGERLPKFASAARGGDGLVGVSSWKPIYRDNEPDVGPLNLRVVPCIHLLLILFYLFFSCVSFFMLFLWVAFGVAQVPEIKRKSHGAKKAISKGVNMLQGPMITNTFGTIRAWLKGIILTM